MKKRRMSALQLKYFGKKKARHKTGVVKIAKRRSRRRVFRGRRSGGGGGLKSMLAPILGGVADSYLDPMLPVDGAGATAVGMLMHNSTLKDIGLYKVGMSLGNILPLPGRSSSGVGGFQ